MSSFKPKSSSKSKIELLNETLADDKFKNVKGNYKINKNLIEIIKILTKNFLFKYT